mmetsp:Transcript_30754/g.73230  ORF Transcript_30754/g.73230 Transcript_30754/m.73230 type:complete len:263 (-) Transcript_30754:956-1744(-)
MRASDTALHFDPNTLSPSFSYAGLVNLGASSPSVPRFRAAPMHWRRREAEAAAQEALRLRGALSEQACCSEAEALRAASEQHASELSAARAAAEAARRDAESARGTAQQEQARHAETEAALKRAESTMSNVLDMNEGLLSNFMSVVHERASSTAVPRAAAGHGGAAGIAAPSAARPDTSEAARSDWEQLQGVLTGLEEEMRELDARYDALRRQTGGAPLQRGALASGDAKAQMSKVMRSMQRKAEQIASLRHHAEGLRGRWR